MFTTRSSRGYFGRFCSYCSLMTTQAPETTIYSWINHGTSWGENNILLTLFRQLLRRSNINCHETWISALTDYSKPFRFLFNKTCNNLVVSGSRSLLSNDCHAWVRIPSNQRCLFEQVYWPRRWELVASKNGLYRTYWCYNELTMRALRTIEK